MLGALLPAMHIRDMRNQVEKKERPMWAVRLERARLAAGYANAAAFARFMNLSQQRYQHYESGAREPDFKLLAEMCIALNVTSDFILLGRDSRQAA